MADELKACPFCGILPELTHGGKFATCQECGHIMFRARWNRRVVPECARALLMATGRRGDPNGDIRPAENAVRKYYGVTK